MFKAVDCFTVKKEVRISIEGYYTFEELTEVLLNFALEYDFIEKPFKPHYHEEEFINNLMTFLGFGIFLADIDNDIYHLSICR